MIGKYSKEIYKDRALFCLKKSGLMLLILLAPCLTHLGYGADCTDDFLACIFIIIIFKG